MPDPASSRFASATPADGLRIGLSTGALYPHTVTEDAPAIAAAWGLRDLELMLQTPGEYAPDFLRTVAASARAADVRIRAVHTWQSFHPLFTAYPRRTAEAVALFRQLAESAAAAGAGVIVWHGAERAVAPHPGAWDPFLRATETLATICAERGLILGVENVGRNAVASVRDALAFATRIPDLAPAGTLGFVFDPFQAIEAGTNPLMLLAAMEDHLVHVHLSDGRSDDPAARHLLPGAGELPWPALLRAIHATGYRGPMMLEAALDPDGVAWAQARALLEPLLAGLDAEGDDAPLPPGVVEGIRLFDAGEWYEAHEAIEHEWHAERGPVRVLYQGILQIGVGLHHARGGNHRGAVLLLGDGIAKVARFLPTCRGVDTARLVADATRCLAEVERLGPDGLAAFDWTLAPVIALRVD
jgi:sugar phosphate isomerase/epimerase